MFSVVFNALSFDNLEAAANAAIESDAADGSADSEAYTEVRDSMFDAVIDRVNARYARSESYDLEHGADQDRINGAIVAAYLAGRNDAALGVNVGGVGTSEGGFCGPSDLPVATLPRLTAMMVRRASHPLFTDGVIAGVVRAVESKITDDENDGNDEDYYALPVARHAVNFLSHAGAADSPEAEEATEKAARDMIGALKNLRSVGLLG